MVAEREIIATVPPKPAPPEVPGPVAEEPAPLAAEAEAAAAPEAIEVASGAPEVIEAEPEVIDEEGADVEPARVDQPDPFAHPSCWTNRSPMSSRPLSSCAASPRPSATRARSTASISPCRPAPSTGWSGPNGAGKTTTLSLIAGLLRPDKGTIRVNGVDAASHSAPAKRLMGVLPDRLRTFDRLTGRQLLYYYGVLRGLPSAVVESRIGDLARAFDLTDALGPAPSRTIRRAW